MERAMAKHEETMVIAGCEEGDSATLHEYPPTCVERTSAAIVFQIHTSDEDSEDDAVTTLGSPARHSQDGNNTAGHAQSAVVVREDKDSVPHEFEDCDDLSGDDVPLAQCAQPSDPQQPDLMLSPASQLHVLSEISEMAARSRNTTSFRGPVESMQPKPHVWARATRDAAMPDAPSTKRKLTDKQQGQMNTKAKKPRKVNSGVSGSLAVEILEWGLLDDPVFMGDESDPGVWSVDEISDSDFGE